MGLPPDNTGQCWACPGGGTLVLPPAQQFRSWVQACLWGTGASKRYETSESRSQTVTETLGIAPFLETWAFFWNNQIRFTFATFGKSG